MVIWLVEKKLWLYGWLRRSCGCKVGLDLEEGGCRVGGEKAVVVRLLWNKLRL